MQKRHFLTIAIFDPQKGVFFYAILPTKQRFCGFILEGYHTYFWCGMRYNGFADMEKNPSTSHERWRKRGAQRNPDPRVKARKNHLPKRLYST